MKVEVNTTEKQNELPFPKLMINQYGAIVLFHEKHRGIIIKSAENEGRNGMYYIDFNMSIFTDFKGSITITQ